MITAASGRPIPNEPPMIDASAKSKPSPQLRQHVAAPLNSPCAAFSGKNGPGAKQTGAVSDLQTSRRLYEKRRSIYLLVLVVCIASFSQTQRE
jgi:hypothetical protein